MCLDHEAWTLAAGVRERRAAVEPIHEPLAGAVVHEEDDGERLAVADEAHPCSVGSRVTGLLEDVAGLQPVALDGLAGGLERVGRVAARVGRRARRSRSR
jgi:hypothetical protein